MDKYDNGYASVTFHSDLEKEYTFPMRRKDLEEAFKKTLDDCLNMEKALRRWSEAMGGGLD